MIDRSLLLDKNYIALSIVSWKKAVKLMANGKAEPVVISENSIKIKTVKGDFKIPTIIRLLVVIPWRAHMGKIKFSRRNLLIRDNGECVYCGKKVGKHATIDHVIPRSRGGKTDYNNCVTSCTACNNKKSNKTPDEAGMRLRQKPKKPSFRSLYKGYLENSPREWHEYIMEINNEDSV